MLLSAGTLPPNPANLLASERMGLVLRYCASRYDVVMIDAPPVMGLADALIISRYADAVIMAVSTKQVKRSAAKNALKRLMAGSANVIGTVMTKFEVDRLDYNYAYRYMAYNYYSYGDPDQKRLTGDADATSGRFGGPVAIIRRALRRVLPAGNRSS